jgi:hypothetical protein
MRQVPHGDGRSWGFVDTACSFISRNHPHTMTFTIPQHAGTRKGHCVKRSKRIFRPSHSSRTQKTSSGKICFYRCSLGEPSSTCKTLSEKWYRLHIESVMQEKTDGGQIDCQVAALARDIRDGRSSDLFLGFRCFTIDAITSFCFAQSVKAINAPNFAAPLVEAMEAGLPQYMIVMHFPLLRKAVFSLPPWLAIRVVPSMARLFNFRAMLGTQVEEVLANAESLKDQPHPIIYHRFLGPEAQRGGQPIPDATSLFNEAQVLMRAGADTVTNTLMIGFFHHLSQPALQKRLRDEVLDVWPDVDSPPPFEKLETLPLLTGTIKEALRVTPAVPVPCTRIVRTTGAMIYGSTIPPTAIVGISILFVHNSSVVFKNAKTFEAERWLAEDSKTLDQWLVAFSKRLRSCLGVDLGWCERYIAYATMWRHFDMKIDGTTAKDLDRFLHTIVLRQAFASLVSAGYIQLDERNVRTIFQRLSCSRARRQR